jgi:hypothetical protein
MWALRASPADRAGATESPFAEILNGLRKRRGREELTFKIRVGQIFNNLAPSKPRRTPARLRASSTRYGTETSSYLRNLAVPRGF